MSRFDTYIKWWSFAKKPRAFTRTWAERFTGLISLWGDSISETARQVVRRRYIDDDTPIEDVVLVGSDYGFRKYQNESDANYLARIKNLWADHRISATKGGIEGLFQAAGYEAYLIADTWPSFKIEVWNQGVDPCTPEVWDSASQDYDGDIYWNTSLNHPVPDELLEIFYRYAPAISFVSSFACPVATSAIPTGTLYRWTASTQAGAGSDWDDAEESLEITRTGSASTYTAQDSLFNDQPSLTFAAGSYYSGTLGGSATGEGTLYIVYYADRTPGMVDAHLCGVGDSSKEAVVSIYQQNSSGLVWGARIGSGSGSSSSEDALSSEIVVSGLPTTAHCLVVVRNDTTFTIYRDGVLDGTFSSKGGTDGFDATFYVGTGPDNTTPTTASTDTPTNLRVAEVGLFKDVAATTAQAQKLCRYSRDKFGTPYLGPAGEVHPYA